MDKRYNCVIVDDEPKAVELLKESILELYPEVTIEDTFNSWQPALAALRSKHYDILFLDISMPGKNGIDLLRLVPNISSEIIFITAYSEYAIDAIKFQTSGYILKPFEDEDLRFAIDKAIQRSEIKRQALSLEETASYTYNSKLGIPGMEAVDYVNINDILYFEEARGVVHVVLDNKSLVSSCNLELFKELVADHPFYQVHRSYIVNLSCVRRFEMTGVVTMDNGKEIPVSRELKDEFLKLFDTVTKSINWKKDAL
ncbi:MAG: response regulator transcription factor [Bacteroidetes bacterium]|nr:response regulator transcription factor [Bacteroidota bacterium]